jgi:iron complex outermembrane receptor protein
MADAYARSVRPFGSGVAAIAVLASASHVDAARIPRLDIPAGPLRSAIVAIGAQADVTIGMSDPSVSDISVRGLKGRMAVATALARILAKTAADYRQVDAETFQIVRRMPKTPQRTVRSQVVASAGPALKEIVVTASKRSASLQNYVGSVALVAGSDVRPDRQVHGSEALVDQVPILSSTHLGPGRNKLFIRGIADSSFNGPTQATVGEYLGEVRLNYNAPDPDLAIYDVGSIEVLEGPQGTLYGAGSLGGIVRLAPNPPDLRRSSLDISGGGALQAHGAPGGDASAIVNLPIDPDRLAVRVVGYGDIDGGYIDDPSRGLKDINRTATRGLRATLRYRPAAGWTIDLGTVVQGIDSRDGQYAERGLSPLQRSSVLAQPFDNDYALGSLTVRHGLGPAQLVSTTSVVRHEVDTTYDASLTAHSPRLYQEMNHITLLTNETRLSRNYGSGSNWVVGVELLRSGDRLTRTLGTPGTDDRIAGTDDVAEEASVFGEGTLHLSDRWFVTGGARLEYARLVDHALDQPEKGSEPHRHATSLLPSAGLLWKASGRLSLYAHYEEGFRPGGLSVQGTVTQRFESDSVSNYEAGLRYGDPGDRFTLTTALSLTHWEDIQADLVDTAGLPYTTNIGTGRVIGVEARTEWRPVAGLVIDGEVFVNKSRLSHPAPAFVGEKDASLPNIAAEIGRVAVHYDVAAGSRAITLSGSVRYVGRSRLGVGTALDLHQGRYAETSVGASAPFGRLVVSLDATNLFDARNNIFALGDPFGVMADRQITPQRPRSIRLGAAVHF